MARETAARVPAKPNGLSDLHRFRLCTHRNHFADRLVTRHERELRHAPFIVEHRQIRMADPAILDFDFNLFVPKRPRIV
jgi:hypothetical protein